MIYQTLQQDPRVETVVPRLGDASRVSLRGDEQYVPHFHGVKTFTLRRWKRADFTRFLLGAEAAADRPQIA
jgi:hypothetical protein